MVLLVSLVAFLLSALYAHSAEYTFVPVVLPFAGLQETIVTGLATDGTMVGTYQDANGRSQGFLWPIDRDARPLLLLAPLGINPDGHTVIGHFFNGVVPIAQRGFVLQDGTLSVLSGPFTPPTSPDGRFRDAVEVTAVGITATSIIVGDYRDADRVHHGFTYTLATRTYTTIDWPFPGIHAQGVIAMSPTGVLVGFFTDAANLMHGVIKDGAVVTQLDAPGVTTGTRLVGITDNGTIVGWAGTQAFTYRAGVFTPVTYPGATLTQPFGVRGDGVIYGRFINATQDAGFLAYPAGVPVPRPHHAWHFPKPWKD
jgi:uncharacterized membrane protein